MTRLRSTSSALVLAVLTSHALAQTSPAPPPPTSTHHRHIRHHRRDAARTLSPVAAQPAGTQASASTPAPVPNESVNAPTDSGPAGTNVGPSVFALHYPPQGDGYVTGSSPQAMDDRNAAKATGVQMKVPLPQ